MTEVVELSTTTQESPGSNPGWGKKFSDGICKYLLNLSVSYVIIICLIVVSVCITALCWLTWRFYT